MRYLLTHCIDGSAERHADRPAFRFDGAELSYAALVRATDVLAGFLLQAGVKRGDRVGVFMPKCLEMPVALYGVMRAGAAFVPLDPLAPAARIRTMIADCGIRVLLSAPSMQRALTAVVDADSGVRCVVGLPATGLPQRPCFEWQEVLASSAPGRRAVRILQDDLAYIIYTSGSTGTPKGIMHTHRSGLAYAELAAALYGLEPEDRLSGHPPLHSDMSTFDFFAGPLAGATTVLIPEEVTKLPASLSQLMQDEALTVWYSVVSALVQLSARGVLAARDLSALRWVLFCGEPMPAKNLRALMQSLPSARFSNVYGPAEVNQCTYYHVPEAPRDDNLSVPIGRVWANTEELVIDEQGAAVTRGDVGELLIRSATMMRGYWNRPDLDARAFHRQPAAGGAAVHYRTGDLVRLQPDGNYLFLGRKDRQIKSRGHRVELDEVEAALASHAGVEEAAAYAVPDEEIGHRIGAAVVPAPDAVLDAAELRAHVRALLPPPAVPSSISLVATLPRTPTGKIDRSRLAELAGAASVPTPVATTAAHPMTGQRSHRP